MGNVNKLVPKKDYQELTNSKYHFNIMTSVKRPAPPPPVTDPAKLRSYFDRVDKNSNGFISAEEFKSALTNGIEDFPFQIFTVRAMMSAFNLGNQQELDFEHFVNIWRYVMDWHKCFKRFDSDKSGCISADELHTALISFGYNISKKMANLMVKRFDRANKNEILFDDFIRCCLILYGLTKEFQQKDHNQVGKTEITYEDFLEMVFSCG